MNTTLALNRSYRFCASHRLHTAALTPAENQDIYGKCNNPFGHGHDYVLTVAVSGSCDERSGLIVNIATLDRLLSEVLNAFHYRNLNEDIVEFAQLVPTTENLALVLADRVRARWRGYFPQSSAFVSGIFIQETGRNSFEVILPASKAGSDEKIEESVIVHA